MDSSQKFDFGIMKQLANDPNAEIRSQCSEVLALIPCEQSENILISLLSDTDDLVRANACDSLNFSHSIITAKKLIPMLLDINYLVRGYSALTLADILLNISESSLTKRIILLLKNNVNVEKCNWVKIAIYRSLVMLGESEYFLPFINMLHSSDYQDRIFVLNIVDDVNIPKYKEEILKHLISQNSKETIKHIKQKIQKKLIEISQPDSSIIDN